MGAELATRLPGAARSMPMTRTKQGRIKRCGPVYTALQEDADWLVT